MSRTQVIRRSRVVTTVVLVAAFALSACGSGSETSGSSDSTTAGRLRNGNVTDADGFGDFQTALSMATSFLKKEVPKWDPQAEIAKQKCTPSNQKFELINPSLAGCVYSDPKPWVDYASLKGSKRTDAIKADYLGWGYQLWKWPRSFKSHNLSGATFKDIDLSSSQKIANPQYKGGNVGVNADFTDATFKGATFINAKVGGSFTNARFNGFDVKSLGDLSTSRFDGADYSGTDLSGMTLPYSQIGTSFNGTNASGISIPNALMMSSTGVNANFKNAKLAAAQIGGAILAKWPAEMSPYRTQGPTHANYTGADFSGADLTGANLQNVNFTNAKLVGTILKNAKLEGANFTGADLTGADLSGTTFGCNTSCDSTVPLLTRFDQATLSGTNLTGASGTRASFLKTNAVKANFTSVALTSADFSMATISGASFRKARLASVDFKNVNGDCTSDGLCTDFSEADTRRNDANATKTSFATVTGGTYTGRATLKGAYFTNAIVSDSEFYNANLSGASFACTHLESTTFTTDTVLEKTVWASPYTDANTRILADQSKLDKRTVTCPVSKPEMSLLQDDANFLVTGKRMYTTTTSTTTTTLPGVPVAVKNPTFTAGQGGWVLDTSSSGATCGKGGQDPSIGEVVPNAMVFGRPYTRVEQQVVVPKAGVTRLEIYVTVASDWAYYEVTMRDSDENNSSGAKYGPVARRLVTVSVTTTKANETVTISLRGQYIMSADGTCQGAQFDSVRLFSA